MQTVIIVIHLMVVLALVGVVLLQRSEGGGSGFMTARGAANALTRATAILAIAFFATSLTLSIMARYGSRPIDILDTVPGTGGQQQGGGVLDQLGGNTPAQPAPANPPAGDAATPPANDNAAPPAADAGATPPATSAPASPDAAAPAQPAEPQVPNQ